MRNWNGFFGVSVLVGLLVFAAIEWQTPSHAASNWYTVSAEPEAVAAYRPATLENQMADRIAALERRVGELELQLARLQPKSDAKSQPNPVAMDSWQSPTVVDVYPSGQVFESTTMTTTTRQTCVGGQCAARSTGPIRRLFGR
jgi:hypothetical protein